MKLIYMADDEFNVLNILKAFLEKENFIVETFSSGDLLYNAFLKKPADLIMLDIVMQGSDGFSICTKLRQISNIPIIMVTAKDSESDYITGLALGSDDYFTKPFSPLSLTMKVKAIFRRIEMEKQNNFETKLSFQDISLCPDKRLAMVSETNLNLTPTEFEVLIFLIKNQQRAVSREELLNKVWGYTNQVETRVTDDTIKRLRKKLVDSNSIVKIETIWGFGFCLKT